MLTLKGMFFKCLLVGSVLIRLYHCSPPECCKPEMVLYNESHLYCNDGNKIHLENCSSDEYFMVNPNDDPAGHFYVDNLDQLMSVNDDNESVYSYVDYPFCQVKFGDELRFVVCFDGPGEWPADSWKVTYFGLCSVVSSVFLALALIVYWVLPELRELYDNTMMSLCGSLMMAFFALAVLKLRVLEPMNDRTCVAMAFLTYYSLLCAFSWMNLTSLNIFRLVWFLGSRINDSKLFIGYCLLGWGVPICFLAFTVVAHFTDIVSVKPGFVENSCWFNSNQTKWLYFYAPMLALVLMNSVYLVLTIWKLCDRYQGRNVQVLKVKFAMCVKLSIVMGVTWIFEIISFRYEDSHPNYEFLWVLMDTLNSLQGFFIFLLMVIFRDKVKKLLAEKRPCNVPLPKSWAGYKDIEKLDDNDVDDFQLSETLFESGSHQ